MLGLRTKAGSHMSNCVSRENKAFASIWPYGAQRLLTSSMDVPMEHVVVVPWDQPVHRHYNSPRQLSPWPMVTLSHFWESHLGQQVPTPGDKTLRDRGPIADFPPHGSTSCITRDSMFKMWTCIVEKTVNLHSLKSHQKNIQKKLK